MTCPRLSLWCLGPLMGLVATGHATAQGVPILNETLSRCAIFQALQGRMPPECTSSAVKVLEFPLPPLQPVQPGAFATTRIQFAFDSYALVPGAQPPLDTLAGVLKAPSMDKQVIRIEGHTDRAGSAAYNLQLSTRRAMSVRHYLHTQHGIALERIPAVGKGFDELYDPQHPRAALNRRVQFVNVGD